MALTKDEILQAKDLESREIEVPEWGGTVCVRMLTAKERDELEAFWLKRRESGDYTNARAQIVALTVCDESGDRLFAEADVDLLAGKSAAAMQRVYDAAMELNGFTKKDVEDLAKN